MHSFTHKSITYLCVLGTVVDTRDTAVSKADQNPHPCRADSERDRQQVSKIHGVDGALGGNER